VIPQIGMAGYKYLSCILIRKERLPTLICSIVTPDKLYFIWPDFMMNILHTDAQLGKCRGIHILYRWNDFTMHLVFTWIPASRVLTSRHFKPRSSIRAKASSRRLPFSTPEVTRGIGISLWTRYTRVHGGTIDRILATISTKSSGG